MKINKSYTLFSIILFIFLMVLTNIYFIKIKKNLTTKVIEPKSNINFYYELDTKFYENFLFKNIHNASNILEKKAFDDLVLQNIFKFYQKNIKKIEKYLIKYNQKNISDNTIITINGDIFNTKIIIKNVYNKEIKIIKEEIDQLFFNILNETNNKLINLMPKDKIDNENSIMIDYIKNNFIESNIYKQSQEIKLISQNQPLAKDITFLKINIFGLTISLLVIILITGFLELINKFKKEKNYNSSYLNLLKKYPKKKK